MAKYLDQTGLETVWGAVKQHDTATLNSAKGYADGLNTAMDSRVDVLEGYFTSGVANEASKATRDGDNAVISTTYVKLMQLGVATPSGANPAYIGVATLGTDGKVPSTQLPSFVDDVIEGYYYQNKFYSDSSHTTEITGEAGKIYVDLSTGKTYRWGGTAYVEISASLAIGTTQGTAYDGASGAQLASDVSSLQTAVNTTIPNTYVPKSSGTNKGEINNGSSYLGLQYGTPTGSAGGTKISLTDNSISISYVKNSTPTTHIDIIDGNILFVGTNLQYKTDDTQATAKTIATTDDITITGVQVNGTSVVSNKVVNLITNTAYNASSNKLATMSDVPSVEAISSADLANILV